MPVALSIYRWVTRLLAMCRTKDGAARRLIAAAPVAKNPRRLRPLRDWLLVLLMRLT